MRRRNAESILQAVRQQPGLSRADVARVCDLAKSTVSSVVDELVKSELVDETGSKESSRGRRPVGLMFNPNSRVAVGLSLDHNRLVIVLCNLDGIVQAVRTKKLTRRNNLQSVASIVLPELQRLLADQDLVPSKIAGAGLAVPGPLPSVPAACTEGDKLNYESLRKQLARELKCSVVIDSNTNMAALAESRLGAARDCEEALVVRLGQEVRSALIVDHKLLKGAQGRAGELGHVKAPGIERACKCGKRGCINSVAATDAILSRCQSSGAQFDDIDEVISSAIGGDRHCREALIDAGLAVGYGIAICINILAPPHLILTGRLVAAGNLLLDPLREAITKFATTDNLLNCNLVFDDSHNHIEAIGASLASLSEDDFLLNLISESSAKAIQEA